MILAIDTTAKIGSIALKKNETIHVEYLETPFKHSQILHQKISNLLEQKNVSVSSLKNIVVNHGPGSFTGVRVGIATAMGFAYALNSVLYCANSHQLMLASYWENPQQTQIATIVSSYQQTVHVARWHWKSNQWLLENEEQISVDQLIQDSIFDQYHWIMDQLDDCDGEKIKNYKQSIEMVSPHAGLLVEAFLHQRTHLLSDETIKYAKPFFVVNQKGEKVWI